MQSEQGVNSIVAQSDSRADVLCRYVLRVLWVGLVVGLLGFFISAALAIPTRHKVLNSLAGIAFWGGIPASATLFMAAFFKRERKASVLMMLLAVGFGLFWLLAIFASFALLWGNN